MPDLSIIHNEEQQQHQRYHVEGMSTALEAPPCDHFSVESSCPPFPKKDHHNNEPVVTAATLCCHSAGETGVEVKVEVERGHTILNSSSHPKKMVSTTEFSKTMVVEGNSGDASTWTRKNKENNIQLPDHQPNPKLKQLPSSRELHVPINEMVKLFVNEGDSLFDDRTLCPRCSAPSPEDELKLNGGYCMACHSEDVGEEFCV